MLKAKLQIRKKIKLCMAVCAAAVMMCSVIPVSAASGEYDVIFRAGSKGGFKGSNETSVTWTKAYGDTVGTAPEMEAQSGYYQTGWSPELTEDTVVTKRQVYVAQYARITDAVDYRVNYVDEAGMPIATQKVTTTQKGAEVTETAVPIDGYTPQQEVQKVIIDKNGTDITFIYTTVNNVVTETQTETEVIPGRTTTTTAGTTTAGAAGTTGAAGTAGTAGTAGGAGTTADGTAGGAGTENQGTTTINDENVPLAQNPDRENSEDTENLKDEEVPKADKDLEKTNPLVYAGIAAAAVVLAGAVVLIIRKRKKNR